MRYILLLITVIGETLFDQTLTGFFYERLTGFWIFLEIFERSILYLLKNKGNEEDTMDGHSWSGRALVLNLCIYSLNSEV